jgi:hypothetical protein
MASLLIRLSIIGIIIATLLSMSSVGQTPLPVSAAPDAGAQIIGGTPIGTIGGNAYVNVGVYWCNGVLIDPEWVLTTASCVYDSSMQTWFAPKQVSVELGCYTKASLDKPCSADAAGRGVMLLHGSVSQRIGVSEIKIHHAVTIVNKIPLPRYGVALLRLVNPVSTGSGITPWAIAQSGDDPTAAMTPYVASFGHYARSATPTASPVVTPSNTKKPVVGPTKIPTPTFAPATERSTMLRTGKVRLLADASCTMANFYGETMWCVNASQEGSEICRGDVGAPLLSTINGQILVFGIVLRPVNMGMAWDCAPGVQSAMIDVRAPVIRDWIAQTIASGNARSVQRNLGGSAGFGGQALARSDTGLMQVDVSAVFPAGIQIGSSISRVISIGSDGIIALGDVKSLPLNGQTNSYRVDLKTWQGPPLIVPYGADGDTRGAVRRPLIGGSGSGSNQVWVQVDAANQRVVVTWDDVQPYNQVLNTRNEGNTYQAILTNVGNSEMKIEYRYGHITWTYGERDCGNPCSVLVAKRAVIGVSDGQKAIIHPASEKEASLRTVKSTYVYVQNGVVQRFDRLPPGRATATPTATATSIPTRTATPMVEVDNPIFIWTGTNSSIPVGWKRVTELDGKFPRVLGNGENNVLATGGSETHSHTSPAHTHGMNWHSHITSYGTSINLSTIGTKDGSNGSASGHAHLSVNTSGPVGASVSWESVQYSPASNDPPFTEVIFITKSTGSITSIPVNVVVLSKTTLGRLTLANGANGTIDLQNRFLRGAPADADAGGMGGTDVNEHDISHVHLTQHDHSDQSAGSDTTTSKTRADESGKSDNTLTTHSHTTYYDIASVYTTDIWSDTTTETVLPPYTDFVIGQNRTGKSLTQKNILALYTGSESNVPAGWVLYTKIGSFIRGSSTTGATGGSATHTHGPITHWHSPMWHSHTGSTSVKTGTNDNNDDRGPRTSLRSHHHSVSVSSELVELESATTTADAADNMPEYVNVYLIEYVGGK